MCVNDSDEVSVNSDQDSINKLIQSMPKLAEMFDLHHLSGEGTFSSVYLGTLKEKYGNTKKKFAIKHIVPTSHPNRIMFELKCLNLLGGSNNVASLNLCLREENNNVAFIMPFHSHQPFYEYVCDMDWEETCHYMYNLLKAISHVHKHGIIHRDIKPSNFLYDRQNKRYLLVDFGLAQLVEENTVSRKRKREVDLEESDFPESKRRLANKNLTETCDNRVPLLRKNCSKENIPQKNSITLEPHNGMKDKLNKTLQKQVVMCSCYGKPQTCSVCITQKNIYASRAGTPGFRPPEVLLKSKNQTQAVDVWGAGIIFLCILSSCSSFFSSPDDMTALSEIITLFGTEAVEKIANLYGYHLLCSEFKCGMNLKNLCSALRMRSSGPNKNDIESICKKCDLPSCICLTASMKMEIDDIFPPAAYDLLRRLLDINANLRITAEEALKHQFFSAVVD